MSVHYSDNDNTRVVVWHAIVNVRYAPIKGSSIRGVFNVRNFLFSLKMNTVTALRIVVIGYMTNTINLASGKNNFWKETSV